MGREGVCLEIIRDKDHGNLELPEAVVPHVGRVCLRMKSADRKAGRAKILGRDGGDSEKERESLRGLCARMQLCSKP